MGGAERAGVWRRSSTLAGRGVKRETAGPGPPPHTCPFLLQRLKYLLTPREPNRWAVEHEGAMPYSSRMAVNNTLRKPTHIIVETMM